MGDPRRSMGSVAMGLLLLVAGVLCQIALLVALYRYTRDTQLAVGAGLEAPPAPSVALASFLTYGTILLAVAGVHQLVWNPPRNGFSYLPVRIAISVVLGLVFFGALVFGGGVVLGLLVA